MEDDDTTRRARTRRRVARRSVMPARLLAVALLTRVVAAVDTDGDGVEVSLDVRCGTPPALTVAVEGRPFGDIQRDCDVDLGDFSLLALEVVLDEFAAPQRNFTGPLAPDGPRVPDGTGRIGARPQQTNTSETIPPNDNCSDAVGVGVGTSAFSNQNAGTDGPVVPPSCIVDGDNQVGSDIWFCHVAICTDTVVVSLCGSEYDTKMAVYEGCECPVDIPIACDDDGCGPNVGVPSRLTFAAEAGQSYLIRIGGFAGAQGTGLLTIFCESDPTHGVAACGEGAGDCLSANGSPACDDVACCEEVCGLDPYCCDVTWDDICAARTEGICTGFAVCETAHFDCFTTHQQDGCNDPACCNIVCGLDELCCRETWDEVCVKLALENCFLIPAVSEWGLIVMTLLVLTVGTLVYTQRRLAQA